MIWLNSVCKDVLFHYKYAMNRQTVLVLWFHSSVKFRRNPPKKTLFSGKSTILNAFSFKILQGCLPWDGRGLNGWLDQTISTSDLLTEKNLVFPSLAIKAYSEFPDRATLMWVTYIRSAFPRCQCSFHLHQSAHEGCQD